MASPISFEQFKSNPITAIAFVALLTIGYLFNEIRTSHDEQLNNQNERIEQLEERVAEYQEKLEDVNKKLIECLAVRNH